MSGRAVVYGAQRPLTIPDLGGLGDLADAAPWISGIARAASSMRVRVSDETRIGFTPLPSALDGSGKPLAAEIARSPVRNSCGIHSHTLSETSINAPTRSCTE